MLSTALALPMLGPHLYSTASLVCDSHFGTDGDKRLMHESSTAAATIGRWTSSLHTPLHCDACKSTRVCPSHFTLLLSVVC